MCRLGSFHDVEALENRKNDEDCIPTPSAIKVALVGIIQFFTTCYGQLCGTLHQFSVVKKRP